MADRQECLDRFYFQYGPCCAGCDWWRSLNSVAGECTRSPPVKGQDRWELLGIERISARGLTVGRIMTPRDYVCGEFKDDFDWSSLSAHYRRLIGDPSAPRRTE